MTARVTVEGLFVGSVEDRWPSKPPTAIGKRSLSQTVLVTENGLDGDVQADLTVHGGPDKALHHYPGEHFAVWSHELARDDLIPGGFGENISTIGLTEDAVCIGDIFALGTAKVQISQGRQPCWKLNSHTGDDRMAWRFQKTGRTGWYYRVLAPGEVGIGDALTLIERPCPEWSVMSVTRARLTRRISLQDARTLATLPELANGWRDAFARLAQGNRQEDTAKRLQGS
ncbi:MOSC domain-containing protein [Hoeflea sp. CAU 1731]